MSAYFDLIQTFYIVPESVSNASELMLSSINLYFRSKPSIGSGISGLEKPGISIWICEVENSEPNPTKVIKKSIISIPYDQINISTNASTATSIRFNSPVIINSGKFYGIVVKFDDPHFDIWYNKQGDILIGPNGPTNIPSTGSQSRFDGILYKSTSTGGQLPLSDRDLKFKVNIAKFTANSGSFNLSNKPYEFLTVNSIKGNLLGGEKVYKVSNTANGTVSFLSNSNVLVGTGTSFTSHTEGQYIVLESGSNRNVLKIQNISNNTYLTLENIPSFSNTSLSYSVPPVASVYYTDYSKNIVYLTDSNVSNSSFRFSANSNLKAEISGTEFNITSLDRYKVDSFIPKLLISNPSSSDVTVSYKLADSSNTIASSYTRLELSKENMANTLSYILSRSDEVVTSGLFGPTNRSSSILVDFNTNISNSNLFSVPYINSGELDFYINQNDINSSSLATVNGIENYDTEIDRNGLAKSKHISKKINFAEGRLAEDIRVFLTAYRPSATDIKVYVKVHNPADKDTFDDKGWTPLELKDSIDKFSSIGSNEYFEYEYGLFQAPETHFNLTGTFLSVFNSDTITTSIDHTSNLPVGSLVKVYDPLIKDNYDVFIVKTVTSNSIVLNKPIRDNNISGNMFVDKLKYKNVAWNNLSNDGIIRYINSDMIEFDTFSSMQVKVVLLSNNSNITPKVDQIQVIGVSA